MRSALALAAVLLVAGGCSSRNPKLMSVTPTTICANDTSTLTLMGKDLQPGMVTIGVSADMGGAPPVAAAMVTGSGDTVMATFTANSLTPSNAPYDLTFIDQNGTKLMLPGAITVVPGISISAVDPGSVYNGVDFPTSVYGTGMGAVVKIQISMGGGAPVDLTGVTAVDNNRADAIVPTGTPPGTYDVTVIDQDGCTATLTGALTVTADLTVSVCAIDPPFGYDMEDTDVVITATADGSAGGMTCGGKTTVFTSSPRAWLDVGGTLKPLTNVAFVSGGSLTATVPQGLTVGGPYDLIVQNPDGSVGLLPAAFKVVDQPVPQITSIAPPLIPPTSPTPPVVHIYGKNFRSPVEVDVYNPNPTPSAGVAAIPMTMVPNPTLVSANEVDVTVNIGALGLPTTSGYALIIRVTDTDQGTYGDFASLAVISPSGNLTAWTDETASAPLPMATLRGAAASGQPTSAARYLYLIGGDGGGNSPTPYAQTQMATLDKYGNIGSWSIGHNQLAKGRTMLGAVTVPSSTGVGGYVYAIGGYDGTAAVATVSRAKILLPSEAPVITKTSVTLGGMLARGAYYYRVSAVLDNTDEANPNGETLPSQEVTAHTVDQSQVTLTWNAVPKAASYRVYRTAMINGTSQDEVLLKDGVTDTMLVDDGTLTPATDRPFKQGELGVWVDVSSLAKPRRFLGVALGHDPTGAAFLYAVGGDNETGYAKTVGANTALVYDTYEYAPLTNDGLTLGAWTEDTTNKLGARTRLAADVAENATSPKVPAGTAYLYAVGGANTAGALKNYMVATIAGGGAVAGAWATQGTMTLQPVGTSSLVSSDRLFAMGGTDGAGTVDTTAASSNAFTNLGPPDFGTLNSDPNMSHDLDTPQNTIAAYASLVYSSAHLYLFGGSSDATTALTRVWQNVF